MSTPSAYNSFKTTVLYSVIIGGVSSLMIFGFSKTVIGVTALVLVLSILLSLVVVSIETLQVQVDVIAKILLKARDNGKL